MSEERHLIEIQYRLAKNLSLLNKNCGPNGTAECTRQMPLVVGIPPVSMESIFAISAEEVITRKTAN